MERQPDEIEGGGGSVDGGFTRHTLARVCAIGTPQLARWGQVNK